MHVIYMQHTCDTRATYLQHATLQHDTCPAVLSHLLALLEDHSMVLESLELHPSSNVDEHDIV